VGVAHESQQTPQRPAEYYENTGRAAERNPILDHATYTTDGRITSIATNQAVCSLTDSSPQHQIITPLSGDSVPTVEATNQIVHNNLNVDNSDNTSLLY